MKVPDDQSIVAIYVAAARGEIDPVTAAERIAALERQYLLTITLRTIGLMTMTVFCAWLITKLVEAQP